VLDNAAVSRHHAQILESHGTYYLEDLRSRNGTQLNDATVQGRVELHDGDQIHLCDYIFNFLESSVTAAPAPTATRLPSSKLPPQGRNRETIEDEEDAGSDAEGQPSTPPPAGDGAVLESSSIITSLDADSVRTVRLNVRPEVKLRAIMEIATALGSVLKMDQVLPQIL
jgi:pSer/pThr/pTyr-binding forkhead associated (FHA) protein